MIDDPGSFDLAEYFGQPSKSPFWFNGICQGIGSIRTILERENER